LALAPDDPMPLALLAMLENEVGDFSKGNHYLERLLEVMALAPPGPQAVYVFAALTIALAARITGRDNRFDVAADAVQVIISSPSVMPLTMMNTNGCLGFMAVFLGDDESAREKYNALVSQRGTLIIWEISTDRLLGLLAHTMDALDQAAEHFDDALAFCRKAGYRPELAWTCCDYSDLLRERDADGDQAKAISLLDESLAISSELGMQPLMERVLSRREILDA